MKKLLVILILPIFFIIYPKIATAEFIKNKIAVLDFMLQGKGFETEDLGQIVAEWLITALVKQGRFDVVERRLLKKIIAEQQLSETGLLDQETTAQLGKVLGVKVVVSGSVMRIQDIIEVNSRIIDVESGSILAAESVKNEDASRLKNLVEEMAQKIIKAFPLEGYVVNRQKERVTIDLGRTSGVKPGMEFIVYKEGEIIKHPKTGEVLDVQKIQTGYIDIHRVLDKISEGSIIKENEPNAIRYGQLVKSSSKDIRGMNLPKNVKMKSPTKDIEVQKGTLIINAVPSDSIVRILNIKPKYHPGILLAPGKYHVEVTSPSYQPKTQWVNILPGEKKSVSIALIKLNIKKTRQEKINPVQQAQPAPKSRQYEADKKEEVAKANSKINKKRPQKIVIKEGLKLSIFPWQLVDEKHWGPDLSQDKIIGALIDTINQYENINLKCSYYDYDKFQDMKIEILPKSIKKFGNKGVWEGKGVVINPNLTNVIDYGKNLNTDLILMGNLLFYDIDGQPESSKYDLYLYLVNVNTGKIETKSANFNELNSVKSIKWITKDILDTINTSQTIPVRKKIRPKKFLESKKPVASSAEKPIPSRSKGPSNSKNLSIFPWQLMDEQHWGPDLSQDKIIGALIDTINQYENINLKCSYYDYDKFQDMKIEILPKSIKKFGNKGVWEGKGVVINPNLTNVIDYGKNLNTDLILMGNLLFYDIDGQPESSKYHLYLYLVNVNTGKIQTKSANFNELNSVKSIKWITKDILDTI